MGPTLRLPYEPWICTSTVPLAEIRALSGSMMILLALPTVTKDNPPTTTVPVASQVSPTGLRHGEAIYSGPREMDVEQPGWTTSGGGVGGGVGPVGTSAAASTITALPPPSSWYPIATSRVDWPANPTAG